MSVLPNRFGRLNFDFQSECVHIVSGHVSSLALGGIQTSWVLLLFVRERHHGRRRYCSAHPSHVGCSISSLDDRKKSQLPTVVRADVDVSSSNVDRKALLYQLSKSDDVHPSEDVNPKQY